MKECPFSSRNKCYIWDDYQIASVALQEAEELCSSNWREISYLMDRVKRDYEEKSVNKILL